MAEKHVRENTVEQHLGKALERAAKGTPMRWAVGLSLCEDYHKHSRTDDRAVYVTASDSNGIYCCHLSKSKNGRKNGGVLSLRYLLSQVSLT